MMILRRERGGDTGAEVGKEERAGIDGGVARGSQDMDLGAGIRIDGTGQTGDRMGTGTTRTGIWAGAVVHREGRGGERVGMRTAERRREKAAVN